MTLITSYTLLKQLQLVECSSLISTPQAQHVQYVNSKAIQYNTII